MEVVKVFKQFVKASPGLLLSLVIMITMLIIMILIKMLMIIDDHDCNVDEAVQVLINNHGSQ